MTADVLAVNTVAATQFVAALINDGTSSNFIGDLVALAATVIAALVMGYALWFSFDSFREKKGKFKQAMPEILGIVACGAVFAVICLKVPNILGFTGTFLDDILPF